MRWLLIALTTFTLALLGMLVAPPVQRFMAIEPPPLPEEAPVFAPASKRWMPPRRPPTVDCRTGRLNPMRPPSWSLAQEALVQAAVLNRFSEEAYAAPPTSDVTVLVAIETLRPLVHPDEADIWPMNGICDAWPELQVSTVESFRRFNRDPGAPGFRLVSGLAPVRYVPIPRAWTEWHALLAPPRSIGLLRFSRVGFSARLTQALVLVDHQVTPGHGQAWYFLLDRTAEGRWRIINRLPG